MNLQEKLTDLCLSFLKDKEVINGFWKEIEAKYSGRDRHYHDLFHLENMFMELEHVKSHITDFTSVSFSVFYHDIIYDAASKSNEEKSALYAAERLGTLGLDQNLISKIKKQILATKSHQKSDSMDTDYLLDADLSILGKDTAVYLDYTRKIRKEYAIYPDLLYKPGRKKVLRHFLELDAIFKTQDFKDKYEQKARENMAGELLLL